MVTLPLKKVLRTSTQEGTKSSLGSRRSKKFHMGQKDILFPMLPKFKMTNFPAF